MSENATQEGTAYEGVAYNDLRKMASDRNLPSSGTKEELIARLLEADASGDAGEGNNGEGDDSSEGEGDAAQEPEKEPEPVTAPAPRSNRVVPVSSREIDVKYRSKAERIKALLSKQPKVMIFIPFEAGENPEQAQKIQMVVNINGYQLNIPRGTAVEVPKQVAEMVMERLASEGKAGRNALVSGNADKETALAE